MAIPIHNSCAYYGLNLRSEQANGLQSIWPLNDMRPNTANEARNGFQTTLYGGQMSPNVSTQVCYYTKTQEYDIAAYFVSATPLACLQSITDKIHLNGTLPFTVMFFAKAMYLSTSSKRTVIALPNIASGATGNLNFGIGGTSGYNGLHMWGGAFSTWANFDCGSTFDWTYLNENFVHYAITYNGNGPLSAGNFLIYINGYKINPTNQSASTDTTLKTLIGGTDGMTLSNLFWGFIKDIRVYNRALSQIEILNIYKYPTDIFWKRKTVYSMVYNTIAAPATTKYIKINKLIVSSYG